MSMNDKKRLQEEVQTLLELKKHMTMEAEDAANDAEEDYENLEETLSGVGSLLNQLAEAICDTSILLAHIAAIFKEECNPWDEDEDEDEADDDSSVLFSDPYKFAQLAELYWIFQNTRPARRTDKLFPEGVDVHLFFSCEE